MNTGQEQQAEQTTIPVKKVRKEPNRLVKYILNHKLVFSLIFALDRKSTRLNSSH